MTFRIFLTFLIALAILRLFVQFIRKNINSFFFLLFLLLWVIVLFFNWNNKMLDKLGGIFGFEHGADLLVYTALFLLFYYVFVSIIRIYKLEQNINKLVRKDAIRDFIEKHELDKKNQNCDK